MKKPNLPGRREHVRFETPLPAWIRAMEQMNHKLLPRERSLGGHGYAKPLYQISQR